MVSAQVFMGAASFGWPPPRSWDDAAENNAPCGSSEDPSDRMNFTNHEGFVILLTQAKAWDLRLGVSTYSHPQNNSHFKPLLEYVSIAEVDAGITCINVPDAPPLVRPGHPATLQLKYVSNYGLPFGNKTFYVCADINYVASNDVPYRLPCFNTTEPKTLYTRPTIRYNTSTPDWLEELKKSNKKPKIADWVYYLSAVGGACVALLIAILFYKRVIKPIRTRRLEKFMQEEAA
ncbi:uncharacterized protein TRIVIDRAFT_218185 [Trichoderma virens Gv29-8]|uniref:Copper acquisition factor BIM1-like domain-containing protein n=1 Tax=Hypocrea virens (strain Gv29-8 / FGSC 10586) TaxID=413071 RepID=G9MH24_HYPVG|nr:uncharacterized protein TRIVIDRAFT_218185 [Trichoderma virens Gv29-8]EHK26016.1 hypothetical protein TRIVIDRAFT_218185 [Trichoderma virens Gv29-8]UKZ46196.1 hypothetical protein TrVGV298_000395 [Trichoderma virens]